MEPYRYHAFVCTQEKPEGVPCCPAAGSFAVLNALHGELGKKGLAEEVQVSSCGCLGLCDSGPVMIVYPEGAWYTKVTRNDVPEIVASHFERGEKVARLLRTDREAMKAEMVDHHHKYLATLKGKDVAGMLPDDVNEMIRGFMPSRVILTALELDAFTAVGDGGTAKQIAGKIQGAVRATEMLLNALVSLKLLNKSADVLHQHAADGAILRGRHARQRAYGTAAHRQHVEALVEPDGSSAGRQRSCAEGRQWLGETVYRCDGSQCARASAGRSAGSGSQWRQTYARSGRRVGSLFDRLRESRTGIAF